LQSLYEPLHKCWVILNDGNPSLIT